jgi:hypothetical protein
MARGKKRKGPVWCECPEPRPWLNGEGVPFSAEPVCHNDGCGLLIKRRPPGRPIQPTFPDSAEWAGPGLCPRPPEVETAAYARGRALTSAPEAARPALRRPAPSPTSALAKPCRDPEEARALLRRLRGL